MRPARRQFAIYKEWLRPLINDGDLFHLTERGRPVTALWPYLGAAGQLWLVDDQGNNFAHLVLNGHAIAVLDHCPFEHVFQRGMAIVTMSRKLTSRRKRHRNYGR